VASERTVPGPGFGSEVELSALSLVMDSRWNFRVCHVRGGHMFARNGYGMHSSADVMG
jgi:hypothetical protein